MALPSLLLILRLTFSLPTCTANLLQEEGNTGYKFTRLGEIDTEQKVKPRSLLTKILNEGSKFRTANFVEMHQLLAINSNLRGPVLDQGIGFGIWIEVVSKLFDDSGLA